MTTKAYSILLLALSSACITEIPQLSRDAGGTQVDAAGIADVDAIDAGIARDVSFNADVELPPDANPTDAGPPPDAVRPDVIPPGPEAPFEYSTTCFLPQPAQQPGDLFVTPVFEQFDWSFLTMITKTPARPDTLFVVERLGRIYGVDADGLGNERELLLDIGDRVDARGEGGLLGVAFHPDYQNNGFVFINYTRTDGGQFKTRIARFERGPDGALDAESELTILDVDQPFTNHNGGMIDFGPDGFLYISMGDGGSGGDPLAHGQNVNTLLGTMLRLDINVQQDGNNYGIPTGNPFAQGGGRSEIFAWGLRNAWRFSFDTLNGDLWVADVGQGAREEVNVVSVGQNLGWKRMEGFRCYDPDQNCNDGSLTLPLFDYPRSVGESISGGVVYRGSEVDSLYGAYLFADYDLNRVFVYRPGEGPFDQEPVLNLDNIVSFAETAQGEVLIVNLQGTIYRLQEETEIDPNALPFPERLSDTGCFSNLVDMTPTPGVFGYDVAQNFWSDGASKERHFVLPEGEQLEYQDERWVFPLNSTFIKTFYLGEEDQRRKIETRFLVNESDRVRGYTYKWNEAQDDAVLIDAAQSEVFVVGGVAQTWNYLASSQCNTCHNAASGGPLGIEGRQLEATQVYEGVELSATDALIAYELFTNTPDPNRPVHPSLLDETESLESRARSYLHVNCSSCHLENGPSGTNLNLDITASLQQMNACGLDPQKGTLGVAGAKLIEAGNADVSVLYLRTRAQEAAKRMPPLGSTQFDDVGSDVLRRWIESLQDCP